MQANPVIKLDEIHKVYQTGEVDVHAVRGISLQIFPGEFVAIMGSSGSGKSTLMNMIGALDRPTRGHYWLDGVDVSTLNRDALADVRNEKIGFVFQGFNLLSRATARENVEMPMLYHRRRIQAREQHERAMNSLEMVGLGQRAGHHPNQLSGGQQQRVALARAIVIEPEVLLLDEPLSNLDANLREEMRSEIRRLHDAFRITTVYVTHDQAEAMVISDRIVVMNHGRIEQVDDPVSMYNRPKTRFVAGFIGRTNFIDGRLDGNRIAFDGFALRADLAPDAASLTSQASFSVRPQTIAIHRAAPSDPTAAWWIAGRIIERAYLGEAWDYLVQPDGSSLRLRAAAPPMDMHETGANVWLQIDPTRVARIPPPS